MTIPGKNPPKSQPREMLQLVLPREHGSWSLALEPLALGLIAAPSRTGFALSVAMVCGFFLRRPLKVLTNRDDPRRALAWTCLAALGGLMAACAGLVAVLCDPTKLWPLLLVLPPGTAFVWLESRGEARAAAAELAGALAFSILPAALATVAGWRTAAALSLAAVMAGRAAPTVMTIRAYLRRRKGQAVTGIAPLLASLVALAVAGALRHAGLAPAIAVWFTAFLVARAAALLGPFHLRLAATRVGVAESILGGIWVVAVAASWPR